MCASWPQAPGAACLGRLAAQVLPAPRMLATCGLAARRCVSPCAHPCARDAAACHTPRTPAPASAWPIADLAAVKLTGSWAPCFECTGHVRCCAALPLRTLTLFSIQSSSSLWY